MNFTRVRKSARRVAKFVKRNPKRPSADAVHRLRTSVRHIASTSAALGLDSDRRVDALLRALKKTRKLAGRVRDMDVLTADALTVDRRGEQDCLVRLLEDLGARRKKRARKLRGALAKKRPRTLDGLGRVEHLALRARSGNEDAAPRAAARAIQYSSKLSHPGRLTRSNLHRYRLKVKELRDVLRLSYRAADSKLVEKLDEVKDAIGDWHDWLELTAIARDLLDHASCDHASCDLIKRLETTRESKYQRALSLTHTLIARYLRAKPRKRTKRAPSASIATPVLEAVSAIVEEANPELAS